MAELKYGWVGKILRADLTTGKLTDEPTGKYAPKFIGGRLMAAKIYWDEVPPGVGALEPANRLIFMTGPNNGTFALRSTRTAVVTKSPVIEPETYCYSVMGGHWGAELKFAGYDGVIIQGKAPEPVYLWINNGRAEIRSAGHLWGQVTTKADEELKRLHGCQSRAMLIGPAGENLVMSSIISTDGHAAAGMGAFGAVMGSKNLKALVVRGTGSVRVARPAELIELVEYTRHILGSKPLRLRGQGGPKGFLKDLVAEKKATNKAGGCWACDKACMMGMRFKDKDVPDGSGQCDEIIELQMEDFMRLNRYTTPDSWEFGRLCDDLGLSVTQVIGHTIPAFSHECHGGTWATELVWAGIWTEANTGLPVGTREKPKVGTREFNAALLKKVAYREGIGDLIARGQQWYLNHIVDTVSSELREQAEYIRDRTIYIPKYHCIWQPRMAREYWSHIYIHCAAHVRQNLGQMGDRWFPLDPPIDVFPKGKRELAVKLFGDERAVDIKIDDFKAPAVILSNHLGAELDCLTLCAGHGNDFPVWTSEVTEDGIGDLAIGAKMFSAVTGIDISFEDMLKQVGERCFNLERAIAAREGRRREHDTYNNFYLGDPLTGKPPKACQWYAARDWNGKEYPAGPAVKNWMNRERFTRLMDQYYTLRGWDMETAVPTRKKLGELGLTDVAEDLEKKYGVPVSP